MTERVSLPPPPKMPREAAGVHAVDDGSIPAASGHDEHVDIDRIATDPPPPPSGAPGPGAYASVSESLAPPTLAPPPEDLPFFHRARIGKIAMTLAALLAVGALSYFMGRAKGRIEGELNATRVQLTTLANSAMPGDLPEPAAAPAPSVPPVPSAALPPTEPPADAMRAEVPAAVSSTSVESATAPAVTSRPQRERAVEEDAESRSERRARRRAEAEARALTEAAETASAEAASEADAETTTVAEAATDTGAPTEPAPPAEGAPPSSEAPTGNDSLMAEAVAAPRPIPTDPLARAVATDPAAQRSLGELASSSPAAGEATPELPDRPSRSAVRAALHRIVPEARRCGVGGVVKVSIAIAPSGEVARANVIESDAPPEVKACIVAAVSDAHFPPFSGSTLVVNYPFRL